APLEEVDVHPRQAGIRRAQEREQLAAPAVEPGVAKQREQRLPERRLPQPQPALERVRDAERRERRVERRAPALERGADDRDLLGGRAVAEQREDLVRDQLERAADAGPFEEAQRTVELGRALGLRVLEQVTLEVRQHRRTRLRPGRQLLDAAVREPGEVLRRARERGERVASRLVRERDGHIRAGSERLEQGPL